MVRSQLRPNFASLIVLNILVTQPDRVDFDSVRSCLLRIIPWCLDSDPSLLPVSLTQPPCTPGDDRGDSDDDFRFWSDSQAKRIPAPIKAAFGVECSYEVILAHTNVSTLTNH